MIRSCDWTAVGFLHGQFWGLGNDYEHAGIIGCDCRADRCFGGKPGFRCGYLLHRLYSVVGRRYRRDRYGRF